MWTDDETSGDGREVRAEIVSNARIEADAGHPADAVIDACAGEVRDSCVVASPCGITSEIEMDETGSTVMYDAARTEDVGTRGPATEDALPGAIADEPMGPDGGELETLSDSACHRDLRCEEAADDELPNSAADEAEPRGRRGALDPVRIRAVTRSDRKSVV